MGAPERVGDAAAAWIRRAGAGAFERAHGTIPRDGRRRQHPGGLSFNPRAILPCSAPTISPPMAQATGDDGPEKFVAASGRDFDAGGMRHGRLSAGDSRPDETSGFASEACLVVHGKNLLRTE